MQARRPTHLLDVLIELINKSEVLEARRPGHPLHAVVEGSAKVHGLKVARKSYLHHGNDKTGAIWSASSEGSSTFKRKQRDWTGLITNENITGMRKRVRNAVKDACVDNPAR